MSPGKCGLGALGLRVIGSAWRAGFTILTRNETRLAILALLWYIMERVVSSAQRGNLWV